MAARRNELLSQLKNNLAFASKAAGLNDSFVNTLNVSVAPPERSTMSFGNTFASTGLEDAVNGSNARRQYTSRSPEYIEDNHQLIMGDVRNSRMNLSEQSDVDILRRLEDESSRSTYSQRPVPGEQKSDNFMQSVMSFLSPQYRPTESVGVQNRNVSPKYNTTQAQHISTNRFSTPPVSSEMDNYSAIRRDASQLNIDNSKYGTAQRTALPDVTFANNQRNIGSSRINIMRPSTNVPDHKFANAPTQSLDRGFDSSSRYSNPNVPDNPLPNAPIRSLDRDFDSSSRDNNRNVSNLSSGLINSRQNESIIRRPASPDSSWPPEREAPVIVKSQLSNDEREQMVSAMEEMHSNVTMLDEALANLKQMRERMLDRPPDEQRDTLLRENSRMQEEINSQLSALRQAAKEIADELLEDVAKLVTGQRSLTSPVRDVGTFHQSYTRSVTDRTSQQPIDTVVTRQTVNTHTLTSRQPQRDQLPPTNLSKSDANVIQLSYVDNGANQKSYAEDALPQRSYTDDFSRESRNEKVNVVPTKQHDSDLDDFAIDAAMQQSNLIFAAMNHHKKQQPQDDDRDQRIIALDKQTTGKGNSRDNNSMDERRSRSAARDAIYGRKLSRDRSTEKRNNNKNNCRSASKTRNKSKRSRSRVLSVASTSPVSRSRSSSRDRLKRKKRNRSDSREPRDRSRNRSDSRDRSRRKDTSKGKGRDRSRSRRRRSVSRDRARSSSRGRVRRGDSRSRRSRNRSSGRRDSRSRLREKATKQRSKSQLRADKEKADVKAKADAEQRALKQKEEKERAALEMIISLYMNAESYYDAGNLWCKKCCCILVDLPDLCKHLHSDDHLRKTDENFDVKRPAVVENISGAMAPARGDEFLLPMVSFFCSLCCDFSKDRNQAEAHIKSVEHNSKFKEFLKENSGYELQFLKEKSSALLALEEKKNFICIDTPPNHVDASKDTATSKATDKFQIKFTGSLKQGPKNFAKTKPLALDDKDDDDDEEQAEEPTDGITRKTKPADLKMNVIPLPATTGTTSSASLFSFKIASSTGTKVSASSTMKLSTAPKPHLGRTPVSLYRPSPTRVPHESKSDDSPKHELKKSIKSGLLSSHILFSMPQDEDLHTSLTSSTGSTDSGWQLSALRTPAAVPQTRAVVDNRPPPAWTLLPPPALGKVNRAPAVRINAVLNKPAVAHLCNFSMPPPRMP